MRLCTRTRNVVCQSPGNSGRMQHCLGTLAPAAASGCGSGRGAYTAAREEHKEFKPSRFDQRRRATRAAPRSDADTASKLAAALPGPAQTSDCDRSNPALKKAPASRGGEGGGGG
eukprot:CAMPEP_0204596450 /NCGR_PEP_ID=MMETSP0661-20131031/53247_1 /ASSEMBLY_ACC=CAM_ASM_000606 /TAXON_ID=109239 /ORGANISM="Alexandrium margalefi, Strain AMGDE01CS-322" /LENGTH=114 /DNA_ID=CAMNT_0051607059 /DNA_START=35 /DNA_END=377 /DNA_ORIENTATION=+